jgi:hypothetical protein
MKTGWILHPFIRGLELTTGLGTLHFRFLDIFAWSFLKFLDIVEKNSEILDSKFFLII